MAREQRPAITSRFVRGVATLAMATAVIASRAVPDRAGARTDDARSRLSAAHAPGGADTTLWMDMRNVDLHVDPRNVMRVRSLHGQIRATAAGGIAWLDDATSFTIRATSGVVALDGAGITALLNEMAFNYPGAPIKHLRVQIEGGKLVQSGVLHKGVDIPFQMWAVPVLQPDGLIRLHPDRLRILGVNGLALMHAIGLHLSKLLDLSKSPAASVKGDDLYLDPLKLIPPPTIQGTLSAVRIEGDLLVQEFAKTADDTVFGSFVVPDSGSKNFVYFRGGTLRLGRLTMTDTDLLIHDADESDRFDLYLAEYNKQLVAGYTKSLANHGLRAWMVDYAKLSMTPAAGLKP